MSFESEYRDLLIKQYWEKPKARAEIELHASTWGRTFGWLSSFISEFDVDLATGDRLDILGRTVGINRRLPYVLPKVYFGFEDNINAKGFASKFNSSRVGAPFAQRFVSNFTELELNDDDYRLFIKVKIANNSGAGFLVSDTKVSIQDVINQAFGGDAYVVDKKDMSLALYITPVVRQDLLRAFLSVNLLPKPQGVQYAEIVSAIPGETFGFNNNPNSVGFSSKFDGARPGGIFARKVIF